MAEPAIIAEGLGKRFGDVTALHGVDLELPAGGVLGVLGPNGAGETTLVRILATLLRPDRGRARVAGFDVTKRPEAVRRRIGLSGQFAAVDPFLTGRENLIMIGQLYGLTRRRARSRAGELTGQLELTDAAGRLVRTYSGGMRRRLDVAASLLAAPPVLFLDEPTTGLDPYGRLALWQVLGGLTAQGTSVVLTTQYIKEAEQLTGMIIIIDHGKVIASGTPDQLEDRAGGDRLELQSPPGQDLRQLAGALAALGTGEPAIDGLITNGKFCCVRRLRLSLTWWRRPLRLRASVRRGDVSLSGERDDPDPDVDRLPPAQPAPRCRAPVGSGLSAAGALGAPGRVALPDADHRGGA